MSAIVRPGKFDNVIGLLNVCEDALQPGKGKRVMLEFQGPMPVTKFVCPPISVHHDEPSDKYLYIFDAERLKKKIVKTLRKQGVMLERVKKKPVAAPKTSAILDSSGNPIGPKKDTLTEV